MNYLTKQQSKKLQEIEILEHKYLKKFLIHLFIFSTLYRIYFKMKKNLINNK